MPGLSSESTSAAVPTLAKIKEKPGSGLGLKARAVARVVGRGLLFVLGAPWKVYPLKEVVIVIGGAIGGFVGIVGLICLPLMETPRDVMIAWGMAKWGLGIGLISAGPHALKLLPEIKDRFLIAVQNETRLLEAKQQKED